MLPAMTYPERFSIAREFSPTTAMVFEAIWVRDHGDGAVVTHAEIAETLGLSISSVQRSINALVDTGRMKSEVQSRGNRQIASRYHFPTSIPVGQNDRAAAPSGSVKMTEPYTHVLLEDVLEEEDPEDVVLEEDKESDLRGDAGASHPGDPNQSQQEAPGSAGQAGQAADTLELPTAGRRLLRPQKRRNIFHASADIPVVLDRFKHRVEEATNRRVTSKRLTGWQKSATALMITDRRPVEEVLAIIDWAGSAGLLAADNPERFTSLYQFRSDYGWFRDSMNADRVKEAA